MSNKTPPHVRDSTPLDPRVARTTEALGGALIELIQERDFNDITVQNILDRAGVGRTAFYTHFRNKEDVLHSSYDGLFAAFGSMLENPGKQEPRLFPLAEFLQHLGEQEKLVGALRTSGQLEELWSLSIGYISRIIEQHLERCADAPPGPNRQLLARMLAGALVESIKWWQEHQNVAAPGDMDRAFHAFARGVLRQSISQTARGSSA